MSASDIGPLDWRVGIVDKQGRPTPEFQRRWNTQRVNNNLINNISTGSGPPTGTPTDGQEYLDISLTPFVLYAGLNGTWTQVGALNFTDLKDAPHSYTGAGTSLVRVNSGATGLEFAGISGVLDGLGLAQGDILYRGASGWVVLAPGSSGQVLSTGGPTANPSWITASSGGGGGPTPWNMAGTTLTPPTSSTVTLVQSTGGGTASLTNLTGSLLVNVPGAGVDKIVCLNQAVPSTTAFTCTQLQHVAFPKPTSTLLFGISVTDTAGKLTSYGPKMTNNTGTAWQFGLNNWNSVNSFNSNSAATSWGPTFTPIWTRVQLASGTYTASASFDGILYQPIFTQAINAFLTTPASVGTFIDNSQSPSGPGSVFVMSSTLTTP